MSSKTSDPALPALVILYGGSPTEHDVSRVSAATIYEAAKGRYEDIILIGITGDGKWMLSDNPQPDNPQSAKESSDSALSNGLLISENMIIPFEYLAELKARFGENLVVFPALHGPKGEDGTIQAHLQGLDIAFVGADVEVSKKCIDKLTTKKILSEEGLDVTPYGEVSYEVLINKSVSHILEIARENSIELPFILKPASLGSSRGVHLIAEESNIPPALIDLNRLARSCDVSRFILEEYISGREMECAVLELDSNSGYLISAPGEIVSSSGIYDYDEKYKDNSAQLIAPAKCPVEMTEELKNLTLRVSKALGIQGLARVDYLIKEEFIQSGPNRMQERKIFVNEVNTMPGFTPISMYPQLMQHEGIGIQELVDRLVQLALTRNS